MNGDRLLNATRDRFADPSDLALALRELRRRRRIAGDPIDIFEEALDALSKQEDQKQSSKAEGRGTGKRRGARGRCKPEPPGREPTRCALSTS